MKKTILLIILSVCIKISKAQKNSDSVEIVNTFEKILQLCKNVDSSDVQVKTLGPYYKVAPFIIYSGKHKGREWRDYTNYKDSSDKILVDDLCSKINNSINLASSYNIESLEYHTYDHLYIKPLIFNVLNVNYIQNGTQKKASFGFINYKGKIGLGYIK